MTGSELSARRRRRGGSAPMMLLPMSGGSLADRHPKRAVLLLTQTGSMLLAFALAFAVWLGKAEPWLILLIAAGNGAAMGFDMPARQSFLTDLTSREDLLNAVSLNSSIVNGARVVGPAVAGLALGHLGAAACFFLNGLSSGGDRGALAHARLASPGAGARGAARARRRRAALRLAPCARADDSRALRRGRHFRVVVFGADAGVRATFWGSARTAMER